jgi:branched-subunit amino acid transport protein
MTAWAVVLLAGLGSYLFRLSMVVLADRIRLPARVEQASAFVAPVAFVTLAVTGVATTALQAGDLVAAAVLLVAVSAAVIAVRLTGRAYVAVLVGMPALWLLRLVTGG